MALHRLRVVGFDASVSDKKEVEKNFNAERTRYEQGDWKSGTERNKDEIGDVYQCLDDNKSPPRRLSQNFFDNKRSFPEKTKMYIGDASRPPERSVINDKISTPGTSKTCRPKRRRHLFSRTSEKILDDMSFTSPPKTLKKHSFSFRKSKSEIFKITPKKKPTKMELKFNFSDSSLTRQFQGSTHSPQRKRTVQKNRCKRNPRVRHKVENVTENNDVQVLFTRETPSFMRFYRKCAENGRTKTKKKCVSRLPHDIYGSQKNNRHMDQHLFQMSNFNCINTDELQFKKMRSSGHCKPKTPQSVCRQPVQKCICKHHGMKVLEFAGNYPSLCFYLNAGPDKRRPQRNDDYDKGKGQNRTFDYEVKEKGKNNTCFCKYKEGGQNNTCFCKYKEGGQNHTCFCKYKEEGKKVTCDCVTRPKSTCLCDAYTSMALLNTESSAEVFGNFHPQSLGVFGEYRLAHPQPPNVCKESPLPHPQPPNVCKESPLPHPQPPGVCKEAPRPHPQPPGVCEEAPLPHPQPPGVCKEAPRPHPQPPGVCKEAPRPHPQPPGVFKEAPRPHPQPPCVCEEAPLPHPQPSDVAGESLLPHAAMVTCRKRSQKLKPCAPRCLKRIVPIHARRKRKGRGCLDHICIGLLIVMWSPCLLAGVLVLVIIFPVTFLNMTIGKIYKGTCAMNRSLKNYPSSEYLQMSFESHLPKDKRSFMAKLASWCTRTVDLVMNSLNGVVSLLQIRSKAPTDVGRCTCLSLAASYRKARKRYKKPLCRREIRSVANYRVVQCMRCDIRPEMKRHKKTNINQHKLSKNTSKKESIKCPVRKRYPRRRSLPAKLAGNMLSTEQRSRYDSFYVLCSKPLQLHLCGLQQPCSARDRRKCTAEGGGGILRPCPYRNRVSTRYPGHNGPRKQSAAPIPELNRRRTSVRHRMDINPPTCDPCFTDSCKNCAPRSFFDESDFRLAHRGRSLRYTSPNKQRDKTNSLSNEKTNVLSNKKSNLITNEKKNLLSKERKHLLSEERTNLLSKERTNLLSKEGTNLLSKERTNLLSKEKTNTKERKNKKNRMEDNMSDTGRIRGFWRCVLDSVGKAEEKAWPNDVTCQPIWLNTLKQRPCFWIYKKWPGAYPAFLNMLKCYHNIVRLFAYFLTFWFWSPLIICMYFCCKVMCLK